MDQEANRSERTHAPSLLLVAAGSLALGAGLMYLAAPDRGMQRRNRIRGKLSRAADRTGGLLGRAAHDASGRGNRAWGGFWRHSRAGRTLDERVRSAIAQTVSFPSAIDVLVNQTSGAVTLSGQVLGDEVDNLLGAVRGVRGVGDVQNVLTVHDDPENIMARLQSARGGSASGAAGEEDPGFSDEQWSPLAWRALAMAGGALGFWAAMRRDPFGMLIGLAGCGLVLGGIMDSALPRWARGDQRASSAVGPTDGLREPPDLRVHPLQDPPSSVPSSTQQPLDALV